MTQRRGLCHIEYSNSLGIQFDHDCLAAHATAGGLWGQLTPHESFRMIDGVEYLGIDCYAGLDTTR
jgi:hypothetical protein